MVALVLALALIVINPSSGAAQSESLRALADDAGLRFGAAVDADDLSDEAYRSLLAEQINLLSTRSELSMAVVQPEPDSFDFSAAEAIVDFAVELGVPVRGHELLGGAVPAWVAAGSWTAETLTEVLTTYVATTVGHFRDRNPGVVIQWDVVGDAFLPDGSLRPTIWQQVIGDDYIGLAFEAARSGDPDAELFYDDFYDDLAVTQDAVASGVAIVPGANAERTTCDAVAKCSAVRDRIGALVEAGAPIDGIGFQAHLFSPDPADFGQFNDWVGGLGLRWAVTEFDVPLPVTEVDSPESLQYQADIYGAALGACVDDPGCDTFVTWGISDRFSPIPAETGGAFGGALWFDTNDVAKPAFDALVAVLSPLAASTTTLSTPQSETAAPPTTVSPPTSEPDEGTSSTVPILIGLAALGAVAALIVMARRRGRGTQPS
jgi:endo-1,4-beta-xylanase